MIAAAGLVVFLLLAFFDVFEAVARWNLRHRLWEVDDLVSLLVVVLAAFAVFSWRRWREVQQALSEVRMLRGMLPICAWCKKIRGPDGGWIQMERYIRDHSEVEFTHGICPECRRKRKPR